MARRRPQAIRHSLTEDSIGILLANIFQILFFFSLCPLAMFFPTLHPRHYAVHYSYVPDVFEKRVPFRAGHLALAQKYKANGKMVAGGAYTEPPMGALLTFCQ